MMMIVLRLLPLLGLKSRWHRHFSLRPLNEVFFQKGDIGGFVDSWPETLVPSASNRSTLGWTRVNSGGLPPRAIRPAIDVARYCDDINFINFRLPLAAS
jgi:hypothetical protein